ncbi:hypothetical protein WMF18_17190 [Sorangium sp. So ce315]|uniref:hypothetical protein n=1 Tax=Sorangium sp. So ce315 TaxID=3133299 RepID=UPI003F6373AF
MDLKELIAEKKKLAREKLQELKPQLDEIRENARAVQADVLASLGLDGEEPKHEAEDEQGGDAQGA